MEFWWIGLNASLPKSHALLSRNQLRTQVDKVTKTKTSEHKTSKKQSLGSTRSAESGFTMMFVFSPLAAGCGRVCSFFSTHASDSQRRWYAGPAVCLHLDSHSHTRTGPTAYNQPRSRSSLQTYQVETQLQIRDSRTVETCWHGIEIKLEFELTKSFLYLALPTPWPPPQNNGGSSSFLFHLRGADRSDSLRVCKLRHINWCSLEGASA